MKPRRRVEANLGASLSAVFGTDARKLDNALDVQSKALAFNRASWNGDSSSCGGWVGYGDGSDAITRAIDQANELAHVAQLWHLFVDAVIAAVPFRHEVFLVEVAAPHRLWFGDHGSYVLASPALFGARKAVHSTLWEKPGDDDPFRVRQTRAAWLYPLLLGVDGSKLHDKQDIVTRWRSDGAPRSDALLAQWESSPRSCGDTLGALWAAYFVGGPLEPLRALAASHPAGAVRSSAALVAALDAKAPGARNDRIRNRRAWLRSAI